METGGGASGSRGTMKLAYAIGRAIFGGFFLSSGINHFRESEAMEQYAGARQVSYPDIAVKLSGALLIASGASYLLGLKPRAGLAGIALFLAAVSPKMHDFWNNV